MTEVRQSLLCLDFVVCLARSSTTVEGLHAYVAELRLDVLGLLLVILLMLLSMSMVIGKAIGDGLDGGSVFFFPYFFATFIQSRRHRQEARVGMHESRSR